MTSELLWFASSWVGNQQELVVLDQKFFKLTLLSLVLELLVVSNDRFCDSLSDGKNLGSWTTSAHANSDVHVLELVSTEEEEGLENLKSEACWFQNVDGLAVYLDDSVALAGSCNSSGVLLSSERLNLFFLLVTHPFSDMVIVCRQTQIIINNKAFTSDPLN